MSSWTFSVLNKLNTAYAAALALIIIQVSIGILYKAAQTSGNYSFSASSSVTISEFLKLLLSTFFFYREWLQRGQTSIHQTLSTEEVQRDSTEEKLLCEEGCEDTQSHNSRAGRAMDARYWTLRNPRSDLGSFFQAYRDELPSEIEYGFAQLALFYVLINNTVFLLYRLADPGTIQLIKSGTTLITALVLMFALKTKIVRSQWLAIILQLCGIVTTQYRPSGAAYPMSTYLILLFQTTISAISSVYNQNLCKSTDKSLHVMNMSLYGSGMCLNFVLHLVIRLVKWDEPGFFTGYGSWGACMVIISNVFIGLAMTAVYKYADAIIKCFATAISTGILLYISPILFDTKLSFLVLPGTCVVFIAAWLYAEATPQQSSSTLLESTGNEPECRSALTEIFFEYSAKGRYRRAGLSLATTLTILIVAVLNITNSEGRSGYQNSSSSANGDDGGVPTIIESPFKNSLAYVRWNSHRSERIPIINSSYSPFFHTMHISMPPPPINTPQDTAPNLTADKWENSYTIYHSIRNTMSLLLENPDARNIDGILFFHFDAWIDPLRFADMDKNKIWFLDGPDPKFECMKTIDRYGPWWGWGQNYHGEALQGVRLASHMQESKYKIDPDEFCIGWSDIYFIPRRFFHDYIALSDIFYAVPVFHELAVPTIVHIIDTTYQMHPSRSIIEPLGDCWGHCCASNPREEDVLWRRCGHKLDFLNENVTRVHIERLHANALILGKRIGTGAV